MNTVQPIRDLALLSKIKTTLREWHWKYYIMFLLGLNTGLRVSDVLNLCVGDVYENTHLHITEQKTGKRKRILINPPTREAVNLYVNNVLCEHGTAGYMVLIPSNKGDNKPITRIQAYRVLNAAARENGLQEIGTHTMRKTFGYWHYKANHDIALLQDIFNHSSPSITLRYIGINDDMKDASMQEFFI